MDTKRSVIALLTLGVLLAGGCPFSGLDPIRLPDGGGAGTSDGLVPSDPAAPATGGGTGGGTTTAGDALSVQFPGCEEPAGADALRSEVLRFVNEARRNNGVPPLSWNATLEIQAAQYACEMVFYDFFDHVNPVTGSTLSMRTEDFGYRYAWVGENLAAGQRTPREVVQDWLESPCHRQNLLHPAFTEIGIGVRTGGTYGIYWVQEFGRPLESGPYLGPEFTVPGCNN